MAEISETERNLKRERVSNNDGEFMDDGNEVSKRRNIRSYYRQIENRITEEKDELTDVGVDKFMEIMKEVDSMHQHVNKPREQVADAEALLGLTSSLAASVKIHTNGSVTPSEFISCLMRNFGKQKSVNGRSSDDPKILWKDIGVVVSPVFMIGLGCKTMMGPMESEIKLRKSSVRVRRTRPVGNARPEEVEQAAEVATDTDRNMQVMFEALKKQRKIKLENLILNRNCFAQTVENLFALSFLVKDGRVFIDVDKNGSHIVAPRNSPSAEQIKTGVAKNSQFIFRFDFNDWKLMKSQVVEGEELMPHRDVYDNVGASQAEVGTDVQGFTQKSVIPNDDSQMSNTAQVKKFSRNCGRNVADHSDLTEIDGDTMLSWNCKRERSIL